MATVLHITKKDTAESIRKKLFSWKGKEVSKSGFQAKKYTGKIKSFGDALAFQRKLRNDWE